MRKAFLILFSISLIIPVLLVIIFSLFTGFKYPDLFPNFFTLKFWGDVFLRNSLFVQSIINSFLVGSLTGIFATVIGFMTGRGVLKFKHKSQRYSYFYGPNSDLYEIWRKSGLFKTVATVGGEGKMLIEISHRGVKLDINLEELERLNDYADN